MEATENKTTVLMTEQEAAAFAAFKKEQQKKERMQRRKDNREAYARLVDEQIALAIPELQSLSEEIRAVKQAVTENFRTVLQMKADVMELNKEGGQHSHTFTNSDATMRITLGSNTVDAYRDTVEDGIAMVKQYISGLAKDEETRALVDMIMKLLAKDKSGQLKASRVIQLRQMAEKVEDERFLEGVKIIEESYQPTETKQFIRAEVRSQETGAWLQIPLSVTDV